MKKVLIPIVFLIILAATAVVFAIVNLSPKSFSDAEKEQALLNILGRKPNLKDAPTGNKLYKSNYVTFLYPVKAKIYTYKDPSFAKNSSVVDAFSFDITSPRLILNYAAIKYDKLSSVSDIPSVKLRQLEKATYKQEDAYADNKSGLAFEKIVSSGLSEKTTFFNVNGKSYSFSIQGNDIKEVRNLYNTIIPSIRFL